MRTIRVLTRSAMLFVLSIVLAVFVDPLYRAMRQAMEVTSRTAPVLPRLVRNVQHAFQKRSRTKLLAGGRGFGVRHAVAAAVLALLVVGGLIMATPAVGFALAIAPAATTRDLPTILKELKALQTEYKGKPMPTEAGEKFEALATEAKAIQDEADRDKLVKNFDRFSREIPDPALPGSENTAESKETEVVGYLTVGQAFTQSEEYKRYLDEGMPKERGSGLLQLRGLSGKNGLVPLTRKQMKEWKQRLEGKAVATVGADVIAPDRIADTVRTEEMREFTLRSLIQVQGTDSNAVEYLVITPAAARAAAPVADSGLKPETTFAIDNATAPVRTIAVHMPVTEQQLQDVPQMQGLTDNELRFELALEEEMQIAWGDGTGQNLLGIFNTPNVLEGRAVAGDTLIDRIRRAMTDVRVARGIPNGVAVHPYDWEEIVLEKGTDSRYVWAVITTDQGERIWGLRVVESIAMEEESAAATPERRILVGDFVRGATIWDRQQAGVAIGYVNDQFIRNQRTLRAEERLAFGVKRPRALRYIVAQAEIA